MSKILGKTRKSRLLLVAASIILLVSFFGTQISALVAPIIAKLPIVSTMAVSTSNWVSEENAKTGTTDWKIPDNLQATDTELSGYSTKSTIASGDLLTLRVTTTDPTFSVRAYRIGYYGGSEGREIWQSGDITGTEQPAANFYATDPTNGTLINMVDAGNWSNSTTIDTTGWPAGTYLLKLINGTSGKQNYIPITVHSDSYSGKTVLINATETWQLYNTYGGYSGYIRVLSDGSTDGNQRSRKVSYDRPYNASGIYKVMTFERSEIVEAERTGVNLGYASSIDVDQGGASRFSGARAIVFMGHDEYWTDTIANTYNTLLNGGTNLISAGGNVMWWRTRFEGWSGKASDRVITIYKSATEDPYSGNKTINYPRASSSSTLGTVSLMGEQYACSRASGDFTVVDPDFFLFSGTGATKGSSYPGLIRQEVDRTYSYISGLDNLRIVAHSSYNCAANNNEPDWSDMTYHTVSSGGGVVNFGTMGMAFALNSQVTDIPVATKQFAQTIFDNTIIKASTGPLGKIYTPTRNVEDVLNNTRNSNINTPTISSSVSGNTIKLSGTFATYPGTYYYSLGGERVYVSVDGKQIASTSDKLTGKWTATYTGATIGNHVIKVYSSTGGSNNLSNDATATVVVPPSKPTYTFSYNGYVMYMSGSHDLGANVKLSIDGKEVSGVNTSTLTSAWSAVFDIPTGSHTLRIWAETPSGIKSTVVATGVNRPLGAPSIAMYSQSTSSTVGKVSIVGKANPGATVHLKLNGYDFSSQVTTNADGTYTLTYNALKGRTVSAIVWSTYEGQTSGSNSRSITVPSGNSTVTAPTANISFSSLSSTVSRMTISGTVSMGTTPHVTVNGVDFSSKVYTLPNGSWSFWYDGLKGRSVTVAVYSTVGGLSSSTVTKSVTVQ